MNRLLFLFFFALMSATLFSQNEFEAETNSSTTSDTSLIVSLNIKAFSILFVSNAAFEFILNDKHGINTAISLVFLPSSSFNPYVKRVIMLEYRYYLTKKGSKDKLFVGSFLHFARQFDEDKGGTIDSNQKGLGLDVGYKRLLGKYGTFEIFLGGFQANEHYIHERGSMQWEGNQTVYGRRIGLNFGFIF